MFAAKPPSASHATSVKIHAAANRIGEDFDHAKIAPRTIAATVTAAHTHTIGRACNRPATPIPAAKTAAIHSAGNFISAGGAGQSPPCEMSAEKDRTDVLP